MNLPSCPSYSLSLQIILHSRTCNLDLILYETTNTQTQNAITFDFWVMSKKKKKKIIFVFVNSILLSTAPSSSRDCCPLCPEDHQMNHHHQKPNSSRDSQTDSFAELSKHRLTNTSCCSHTEAKEAHVAGQSDTELHLFLCQFSAAVASDRTNSLKRPAQTRCSTIRLLQHQACECSLL